MKESERIKSVASHYGSQEKLARALGTTQSNVANWIQRGSLTSSAIKMFAQNCPEISLEWLTKGRGAMFVDNGMIDTPGHVGLVLGTGIPVAAAASLVQKPRIIGTYGLANAKVRRRRKKPTQDELDRVRQALMESVRNERGTGEKTKVKKSVGEVGKRRQNEILNESLGRVAEEIKMENGKLQPTPYIIKEESGVAVLPVQRKAELYFQAKGVSMPPAINEGDVVGIVSADWFEVFSPNNIYLLALRSGEIMIKRIVLPGDNDGDYIIVKSDNPEDPDMQIQRGEVADIKRICYVGKNL